MIQSPSLRMLHRRRGVSAPALLMAVMMALAFVVLAVDLAQLSLQRHQMQIGASASSLAAAAQIMDKRWLYLGPENAQDSPQAKLQQFENISLVQAAVAGEQAAALAATKKVSGQAIVIDPASDLELGWLDDPADRAAALAPRGPRGEWNAVGVRVARSSTGGAVSLLWMARQTGMDRLDVRVQSVAMVDTRLDGFRPLRHVRVPLVPLAVLPDEDDLRFSEELDLPEHAWWAKGPQDDFTVDTQQEQVGRGGDGIAEMVLRLRAEDGEEEPEGGSSGDSQPRKRRGAICKFFHQDETYLRFAHMAEFGLGEEELAVLGGQITCIEDDPPAMLPADFRLDKDQMQVVREGLLRQLGRPRVWPVAATVSSAMGEPAVGVFGFVAGSVVDCTTDEEGSLLVVIQPCLLQTPTALTSEASLRNPWIGKLLLVR